MPNKIKPPTMMRAIEELSQNADEIQHLQIEIQELKAVQERLIDYVFHYMPSNLMWLSLGRKPTKDEFIAAVLRECGIKE